MLRSDLRIYEIVSVGRIVAYPKGSDPSNLSYPTDKIVRVRILDSQYQLNGLDMIGGVVQRINHS